MQCVLLFISSMCYLRDNEEKKQSAFLPVWLEGSHSVAVFAQPPRGNTAQRLQPQILLISATLLWAQKYDADVQI